MLTNKKLQVIKERCDAANTILLPAPEMVSALLLKGISREDALVYAYSHYDIPDLLAHIEEQQDALCKAEADKAVLVESLGDANDALIRCESSFSFIYHRGNSSVAAGGLKAAINSQENIAAALARVKGEA